jgi:hypothetical protein
MSFQAFGNSFAVRPNAKNKTSNQTRDTKDTCDQRWMVFWDNLLALTNLSVFPSFVIDANAEIDCFTQRSAAF